MLMNSVPKDCMKQTDKVTLVDVTGIPNHPYQKLVIYRNPSVGIYDIEEHLDADCSGCILIDAVVCNGNNRYRFIECQVENGEIVTGSASMRLHLPHPVIVEVSEYIISEDPNIQVDLFVRKA